MNVLAELLPTVLISCRDGIKQHHPIQTGQTKGLLQAPSLMATAGACITAHQSAAAAMAPVVSRVSNGAASRLAGTA